MTPGWSPAFGAILDDTGATLRICAPGATVVCAVMEDGRSLRLERGEDDVFAGHVAGARAGHRYQLRKDDGPLWPDPCSRFQPEGVHGPSMLIDANTFAWTDASWRGVPRHALVIYELHVGTFTEEGTFAAAMARLPDLVELGVTAIELMPIAAFPGRWNWGYDGAALFAPSERYGHPDDLRRLVDRAHTLGLAVLLDVVYNHLGPDGAYLAAWMPTIFSDRHRSAWGRGINLDGPGSAKVRRLLCDNALHWLLDYHFDGLRLDATHALVDDSPEHLLAQLAREVGTLVCDREVHLIAEDERNLNTLLMPVERGGAGMTGVWADDFHHAVRRHLAGDHEAWFTDFTGTTAEIATAVRDGWVFSGQPASHYGGSRGTSPEECPIEASVICLQNHDQVGNRAMGDRLHHQISCGAWLAATALLLTAPETPLLFMGQEWAASSPFLFFTDHPDELGRLVVEGRRREFSKFSAFADEDARAWIPNPQAEGTLRASVLRWEEREANPQHTSVLDCTRRLLQIRRAHLASPRDRAQIACEALDAHSLRLLQPSTKGGWLLTIVDFDGSGPRDVRLPSGADATTIDVLEDTAPLEGGRVHAENGIMRVAPSGGPYGLVLHVREVNA